MSWKADIKFVGTLWNKPTVTAEVRAAMQDTADFARTILPKNTPVDTGRLANSWRVSVGDRIMVISNPTPYAGFVEYGTRKMAARNMLGKSVPAIEAHFKSSLESRVMAKLGGSGGGSTRLRSLATQVAGLRGFISPTTTRPIRN